MIRGYEEEQHHTDLAISVFLLLVTLSRFSILHIDLRGNARKARQNKNPIEPVLCY